MNPEEFHLRPAMEEDFLFLCDVHRLTMKPHIQKIWGWDEGLQARWLRERFVLAEWQVVEVRGESVGVLQVQEKQDALFITDLLIHPVCQARGIGTAVLSSLIAAARRPLSLSDNPARRLYARLGFRVVAEDEHHCVMRREL